MASEFSSAYSLGQLRIMVWQLQNVSPNCIVDCLCNFSSSHCIFGCTTEMVLEDFRGQLEKVVLSIMSAFLLHYIQMEFPTA